MSVGSGSAINRHNRQLFDDFVGAQQYRWGYGKAERLGGLAVHGHLVFYRKLHREIARLAESPTGRAHGQGAHPCEPGEERRALDAPLSGVELRALRRLKTGVDRVAFRVCFRAWLTIHRGRLS